MEIKHSFKTFTQNGAMLRTTGIEQDYYRSKYRESISDPPSKKNKEFVEALKEMLG